MAVNYEENNQQADPPICDEKGNILWFRTSDYIRYLARTGQLDEPAAEVIANDPNRGITQPHEFKQPQAVPTNANSSTYEHGLEDRPGLPKLEIVDGVIQHELRIIDVPEIRSADVIPISPAVYPHSKPETKRFEKLVDYKQVAKGGLRRFIKATKNTSLDAVELAQKPFEAAGNLRRRTSAKATGALMSAVDSLSMPELKKPGKKTTLVALGSLALVGGYLASRGLATHNLGSSGHVQEAAANLAPKNTAVHHEIVQHAVADKPMDIISPTSQLTTKLLTVSGHTARVYKKAHDLKNAIKINPGDGYTQAIANRFPNHSAYEYAQTYKEAIKKYGPNFIKGIRHYKMADGNWGFSGSGKARISQAAMRLFSGYFKTHN